MHGVHLVDSLVFGLEAERLHGRLELLGVDGARAVRVEQIEGLADLFNLLLREARPLVGLGGALAGRLHVRRVMRRSENDSWRPGHTPHSQRRQAKGT